MFLSKFFKTLLCSAIVLCIYSCGDDNDEPQPQYYPNSSVNGGSSDNGNNGNNGNSGNNGNNDDDDDKPTSQLAGTRWGGRVDDFYIELDFRTNGTFKEMTRDSGIEETYTYRYKESGSTLLLEEGSVTANTFGDYVEFSINSSKTELTLKGSFETWTLTRKL